MRSAQKLLALGSTIGHLGVGLAILLGLGPTGSSPAWSVLADVWSRYASPAAFLLVSILALVGYFDVRYLRLSLYLGSAVMLLWALALSAAWLLGYGPQLAAPWLAWIGLLKWTTAEFGLRLDKQTEAIVQLADEVSQSVKRSEEQARGRSENRGAGAAGFQRRSA